MFFNSFNLKNEFVIVVNIDIDIIVFWFDNIVSILIVGL